jgi:hypothetical protein
MTTTAEIVALVIKHQPISAPEFDKVRPKGWTFSSSIKLSDIWRSKHLSRINIAPEDKGPRYAYAAPDYPNGVMYGGKQLPATVPKPVKSKLPDTVQPYPGDETKIVIQIGNKRVTIEDV